MGIRLWLDDQRDPKEKYIKDHFGSEGDELWVKTAQEAISVLEKGDVACISFDHDLGPGDGTGYDVALWIERSAFEGKIPAMQWHVHSMNHIGRLNIMQAMRQAEKYWEEKSRTFKRPEDYFTSPKPSSMIEEAKKQIAEDEDYSDVCLP